MDSDEPHSRRPITIYAESRNIITTALVATGTLLVCSFFTGGHPVGIGFGLGLICGTLSTFAM